MCADLEPPTHDEIAAYRTIFRYELDKRMDTSHPSASPSTEAHAIALRSFIDTRNARKRSLPPRERQLLLDALAVSILGADYGDRCHAESFFGSSNIKTPPEFVTWARQRMGENYDPTCQYPVKVAIEGTR